MMAVATLFGRFVSWDLVVVRIVEVRVFAIEIVVFASCVIRAWGSVFVFGD